MSKDYEYFLKILEYQSISKAAEALYISQPSLTKYLQRLESAVGARLLERKRGPVKLTYAGELFYEYILKTEEEKEKLDKKLDEIRNFGRGRILIGMPLWRSNVLLPEFLPFFYQKHPLIEIKLMEGSANQLEHAIVKGDVDFGIMNLPVNHPEISYEEIAEEHIFLAGSRAHALVQKKLAAASDTVTLWTDIQDFAEYPFILTQPDQHITGYINNMLSRRNLKLNCIFRTKNVSTAVNFAAANLGFTFVPEIGTQCRRFPNEDVALFQLNSPPLTCSFAIAYKKSSYLSKTAQIFIKEFQHFCNSLLLSH